MRSTFIKLTASFAMLLAFVPVYALHREARAITPAIQSRTSEISIDFAEPHNIVVLSVPDQSSAIKFDLMHLRVKSDDLRRDLQGRRLVAEDSKGWVISSFLYPREAAKNAVNLREREWTGTQKGLAKDGIKPTQIKLSEKGSIALLEYTIEEFRGQRVHQKNVFGYIVNGNLGIDFHISKMMFTADDQRFLDALVEGISIVENYQPDSKTEFGFGSMFYLDKNWQRASGHYARALDLEKKSRTLPTDEWRVLVDNLGMAYALNGDLANARTTFEYGAQQDSSYPMFHYNLACYYGETGDLDRVLEQLKVAFQNREKGIAGEGIPDPIRDDSFKRYLQDQRFQALSKELCPSSTRTEQGWVCTKR